MPWTFHQKTGAFLDPQGTLMFNGYSGHGPGVNNPDLESRPNVGPIPRGLWSIGPAFAHPKLGPVSMRLAMQQGSTFGRTAFLIHGDNGRGDRSASEGCIILPRLIRERVAASDDRSLLVVEQPGLRLPPGTSPALACILLAIDLAHTVEDLATWWRDHQPALRRLPHADLAAAIAAKDARKLALTAPPEPLPDPGIPPPSVVLPPLRRVPGYDGRRLI